MTKLSKYLTLEQCNFSETAIRLGLKNECPKKYIPNLAALGFNIYDKIVMRFGLMVHINSGYRSTRLNKIIGGSINSQHIYGQAIDLDCDGTDVTNKELFVWIANNLEFDQLIWEFSNANDSPAWIHVSFNLKGNRRQI